MSQKQLKAKSTYLLINIGNKKTNQQKMLVGFQVNSINSIYLVKTTQRYQYQYMNRKRKYQEQK